MQAWVNELVGRRGVDLALCYCSGVAPFVLRHAHLPRVMDFVDADSDKWRQYAKDRRGLARWLYAREARRLAAFEIDVAKQFDVGLFVSDAEAGFFRDRSPAVADKIRGIANGVDADYWNPERAYPVLYQVGERVVVFVGAMDYRANADAAQWFAREVWPRVAAQRTDARFYIVGSRPNRDVLALAKLPGITVTGKVDDVRPYLAHAHAVVTPLRIARGIQNKVLEALAMEKVVLATPAAWEGIDDFPGREGCITDAADEMAAQALVWLDREPPAQVPAAREMVRARFDWTRNLDTYVDVLAGAGSAATGMATSRATAAEACP
jgi:sugar transferase (PEP-CTERM/EpsH1 system associated)